MSDAEWQYILDEAGQRSFVVIPVEQFKSIRAAAQKSHDFKQLANILNANDDMADLTPAEVVRDMTDGAHPVRAWRKYKKLKAVELARQAGISPAYLSEIETGKKDGTFKTMAAIAICLGVTLDDLTPVSDPAERASRAKRARRTTILKQIKLLKDMMGDDRPFDIAAVRETSEGLSKLAIEAGLDGQIDEQWLALVYDVANTMIDRVNDAEQRLINTATGTRQELVNTFAVQLQSISDK
jgi:transcriptional regulator with XRE-family HTH domain